MKEKKIDFYTMRRNAIQEIDKLLFEDRPKEWILYYICGKYGIGEKMVLDRIQQKTELDLKLGETKQPKPENEI